MSAVREPLAIAGLVGVACVLLAFAMWATGCGAQPSDLRPNPADVNALKECRHKARAAFFVDGYTEDQALRVYEECKKDGGL